MRVKAVLTNLTRREKMLFYLTVGVISLSLVYKFALLPLTLKWRKLNQEIIARELELRRNVKLLRQKNKVEGIYQKYAEYIKKGASDEEETASLLKEVEKNASTTGIHIANIRPKPIMDLVFCKKYILELNCEARMENLIEFIYNLQSSAQLVRVEKLKLLAQGKNNPLVKVNMLITRVLAAN